MNYLWWLRLIRLFIELSNLLDMLNYDYFECVDFESEMIFSNPLNLNVLPFIKRFSLVLFVWERIKCSTLWSGWCIYELQRFRRKENFTEEYLVDQKYY